VLCNNHLKVNKVKKVSLSNFTVSRIIDGSNSCTERDLYKRVRRKLMRPLRSPDFCEAHTCVRIKSKSRSWYAYLALPIHSAGEGAFSLTDLYEADAEISWEQCADVCTDGTGAMVGL
jgi:hypothetical protein